MVIKKKKLFFYFRKVNQSEQKIKLKDDIDNESFFYLFLLLSFKRK